MMTRKFNQLLVSLGVTITLLTNAYPQSARTVMVQSNTGVLLFPTNLWSANAAAIRSGLSLPANATSAVTQISDGGTGATNAAVARTNLGLGWSALTNQSASDFRAAIGLSSVGPPSVTMSFTTLNALFGYLINLWVSPSNVSTGLLGPYKNIIIGPEPSLFTLYKTGIAFIATNTNDIAPGIAFYGDGAALSRVATITELGFSTNLASFWSATSASNARSAIGLSANWLTNTNPSGVLSNLFGANTNPVLVNTSGVVVSPTNFWSYAPGAVIIQDFTTNVLTSTTNSVTNARNVFVYSFTTNVTGATHTLELPTNASSGDFVTVTHTGPTSSITAVRTAGTTNNLVNLSQVEEQVRFVYRNSAWRIEPPRALTTPLYFSGSSASANAATSRTNLGIPLAALTNTDVTNFQRAIFAATNAAPSVTTNIAAWVDVRIGTNTNSFKLPLYQ